MERVINRSIRILLLSVQYFNSAIYCVNVKPICKMYLYTKSEVQSRTLFKFSSGDNGLLMYITGHGFRHKLRFGFQNQ